MQLGEKGTVFRGAFTLSIDGDRVVRCMNFSGSTRAINYQVVFLRRLFSGRVLSDERRKQVSGDRSTPVNAMPSKTTTLVNQKPENASS
jgi:hypothetical protein